MKKKMRKIFAIVLAITLVFSFNVLTTKAAVSGVLSYEVVSGKAVITDCNIAVMGEYTVPSKIDGYSVVKISDYAFSGCDQLTSIVIPEGVTSVGSYAFAECDNIISIDIPSTVTSVGTFAFYNCENLSEIVLPTNITSISNGTFKGCSSLSEITIPSKVTSIGTSAFEGCTNMVSIKIPESVSSIGEKAFYKCSNIENITIPSKVTSIAESTFSECVALKSVNIPANVVSIGTFAFDNCQNLEEMIIPSKVTSIGAAAFSGCSSLSSVTVPVGVKNILNSTFNGCSSLESLVLQEGLISIGKYAFCGCNNLTEIVIPEGVTSIGDYAFSYNERLTDVDMPSTVATIGDGAFLNAYELKNITIPKGVTRIGNSAFSGCESLTNLVLPETLSELGKSAFKSCKNLQTINIPSKVDSIKDSLFYECINISEITIPVGVTCIDKSAFAKCEKIEEVVIPYGVKKIGAGAFQECTNLSKIEIPYSVTDLGESIFEDSTKVVIYTTSEYVRDYAITYQIDYAWTVDELYIKELPDKIDYDLNETLSLQGLILKSVCDGEALDVTEGYVVDGFDSSVAGVCTLTVQYGGRSTTFDVIIHDFSEWQENVSPSYTTEGEKERSCNICGKKETVVLDKIVLTKLSLNETSIGIIQGESFSLVAEGLPYAPKKNEVAWESTNPDVVTVDENGVVTGKSFGNAMVIATVGDMSATCEVKVSPPLQFYGASLCLENDITVLLKAKVEELDRYYMEPYAVVTQELEEGQTETQIIQATISEDGMYYEFRYTGVNAEEIGDKLDATIYAYDDYGLVKGKTITGYSVVAYCQGMLKKTSEELNLSEEKTAVFKTLLVDLVNYGSDAQNYFGYKTDTLAKEQIGEEYKELASDDSVLDGLQSVRNICYEKIENPSLKWKSASLILKAKTTIILKVEYEGDINDVKLYARMENGNTYLVEKYEAYGNGIYCFEFDQIKASEFGRAIDFYFMKGDTVISNTPRYSVESYVVNKVNDTTVGPVLKTLTKYGKSALKYVMTK